MIAPATAPIPAACVLLGPWRSAGETVFDESTFGAGAIVPPSFAATTLTAVSTTARGGRDGAFAVGRSIAPAATVVERLLRRAALLRVVGRAVGTSMTAGV